MLIHSLVCAFVVCIQDNKQNAHIFHRELETIFHTILRPSQGWGMGEMTIISPNFEGNQDNIGEQGMLEFTLFFVGNRGTSTYISRNRETGDPPERASIN